MKINNFISFKWNIIIKLKILIQKYMIYKLNICSKNLN